jgi:ABC-type sugar transport system ATPase subunit
VDVGAKAEIYDLLFEMAGRGMAILAISSEIPELLAISDRILVMRSGRIQGELAGDAITESGIGEMMLAD